MNATADSGENPELPGPGAPGLPLSAPVAATVLPDRELNAHFREPDDQPRLREPDDQPRFGEPAGGPRFGGPDVRPRPDIPAPARPAGHGPRPGAHAPAAATPAQVVPAQGVPAQGVPATAPGHDRSPYSPAGSAQTADWSAASPPEDPERVLLRKQLDAVRVRAASASSWLETSTHYARLLNRGGVVPVTARFTRDDIEFLGRAREEVLGFAELGLRLLELHAPLDAGGISTDPSSPILRCRSCMWRWPCPTFRMLTDALGHLPPAGPPPAR
jgi:hypothetical protein